MVFSCGIVDYAFEEELSHDALYLDIEDGAVLTLAAEVENRFLGTIVVRPFLSVAVLFDILDPDILRKEDVEKFDEQFLVVRVCQDRLESRVPK